MKENKAIIYGRHPVIDAIQAGKPMDKVLLQQGIRGEMEKEIRHLCKEHFIPLQVVPKERFSKFTNGNHQGILAFTSLQPYYKLENILPTIFEKEHTPLFLLLDGVTDVRNFGAIARSAECCGVHAIIVSSKNSAPINEDSMKTSAGALAKIPICRETSIMAAVEQLQLSGIQVFASDLNAKGPIFKLDFSVPTAIIMGSEGEGVNNALLRTVNDTFIIPQIGTTDSFNVSVAAGIILYEVLRQRMSV